MSRLILVAVMLTGLLALSSWLQAADEKKEAKKPEEAPTAEVDPVGKWPKYKPGLPRRYQIWYDDDGWHFHTTTAGERHQFSGFIRAEGGTFTYLKTIQELDRRKGKAKDYGYFSPDRTMYTFRFTTQGYEDGLVFNPSAGVKRLYFNLKIDDKEDSERIYIGKKAEHPPKATFYLPAFPGKKKD